MSRVPSAYTTAAARSKRSRPAARTPSGPASKLPARGRGPACAHSGIARRRGPASAPGERAAALLRRGEARPARNCPSPRGRRASAADSSCSAAAAASTRGRLNRDPPAGPRASTGLRSRPGSPDEERGSAPRQVMDPRGNSLPPAGTQRGRRGVTAGTPWVRRPTRPASRGSAREVTSSRRPKRGFPSGLHLLLPALPPPPPLPPEKAPRKPPHFPSRPRLRDSGRPFGRARPLEGEWPARLTSRAPRAGGAGLRRLAGLGEAPGGAGLAARPPVALRASPRFFSSATRRPGSKTTWAWASSSLEADAPSHAAEACSQTPRARSLPLAPSFPVPGSPFYPVASRLPPVFWKTRGRSALHRIRQSK